ncbi:hypothetical protein OBBRIDRAFT_833231 [Obba rivulosa]|uniref:Uncharacterized protein n=1 Tax=Obba rivulosa TaxID=1052685 RepID=A0A8E2B0X4_9APHY|nr:hypothetical protein OBBRIDRAFT_833231 [Obba rivulosa]
MDRTAPSARPPTFSLQEFNDLLCAAFNLPHETLPLRDPLIHARSGHSLLSPAPSTSSCFDSDTEDDEPSPAPSRAPSALSRSLKPRAGTFTALNVFKHVRARASALVLRTNLSSSASTFSESSGSTHTARPSLSSQRTLTPRLRSAASSFSLVSRPSTPAPRPSSPFPFAVEKQGPLRRRDPPSPVSFLKLPKRATSRPATPSPLQVSAPTLQLASFFDDSAFNTPAREKRPPYTRPSTPLPPPSPQRVHARLPPLRSAQSFSLFGRTRPRRMRSGLSLNARNSIVDVLGDVQEHSLRRLPSPYTCPRDAPPVPALPSGVRVPTPLPGDDLEVPDYVYARRGSTTSSGTSGSGSSLSSRLSSLLPLRSRRPRKRSKLSLRVVSARGSPDSSPGFSGSSTSTHDTRSPTTPTFGDAFGAGYTFGTATATAAGHEEMREEALSISRVLTPEEDPFAKGDICVAKSTEDLGERGKTPTPGYPCALSARWHGAREVDARNNHEGSMYEESTYESALEGDSSFGDDEYHSAESGSVHGSASGFTPTKRAMGLRPSMKARSRSHASLRVELGSVGVRFPMPPPLPASVSEPFPYTVAAARKIPVGVPVDVVPELPGEASVGLWESPPPVPPKDTKVEKAMRPASLPARVGQTYAGGSGGKRRLVRVSAPEPLPEHPVEVQPRIALSTPADSASTFTAAMIHGRAQTPLPRTG